MDYGLWRNLQVLVYPLNTYLPGVFVLDLARRVAVLPYPLRYHGPRYMIFQGIGACWLLVAHHLQDIMDIHWPPPTELVNPTQPNSGLPQGLPVKQM